MNMNEQMKESEESILHTYNRFPVVFEKGQYAVGKKSSTRILVWLDVMFGSFLAMLMNTEFLGAS